MITEFLAKHFPQIPASDWSGPDVDLQISLFDCGILWARNGSDWLFVYDTGLSTKPDRVILDWARFPYGTDPVKEFSWANLLPSESSDPEEFPYIVRELLVAHGAVNVFGTCCHGFEMSTRLYSLFLVLRLPPGNDRGIPRHLSLSIEFTGDGAEEKSTALAGLLDPIHGDAPVIEIDGYKCEVRDSSHCLHDVRSGATTYIS